MAVGPPFARPRHCGQVGAVWSLPGPRPPAGLWTACGGCSLPRAIFQVWREPAFIRIRFRVLVQLWTRESTLGPSGRRYPLVLRHLRGQPQLWEWRQWAFHLLPGEGPRGPEGRRDWVCVGEQTAARRAGLSPGLAAGAPGVGQMLSSSGSARSTTEQLTGQKQSTQFQRQEGRGRGPSSSDSAPDGRKVTSVSLLVMALVPSWGLRLMAQLPLRPYW